MEKGTLVEFRHHNERVLAIVEGMEGKKNLVLSVASGHTHSVHPRQITFTLASPELYRPQDIPNFWQQVEPLLDPEALAIAWDLLQEEHRTIELHEIAQILYSDASAAATYATYRLLSEDRIYFKQKGQAYEPRPSSQVKEIQHQLSVAQQKEREQLAFEAHLQAVLSHAADPSSWTGAERQRLECLERFALHGDAASDRDQAVRLLGLIKYPPTANGAFAALVDLGLWSKHENLALRLAGIPTRFSQEVEALAQSLQEHHPPDRSQRHDLTHLHTYTIDDASTREIDDGLSVEWLADGQVRYWIHIADPTRWLVAGEGLDLEARRRGTSVYLPEQSIPMFPQSLASGLMSLIQGRISCALSFGISLTAAGAIAACQIVPSFVKVTYRLTYEDADEMLELGAERELTELGKAAQVRFRWRTQQGAINIGMPEQDIKVIDGAPYCRVIEDTPSRQMVAEMMVLTGEAAATFASRHQIPVPYRHQPVPDLPSPEELAHLSPGPVYAFALMRCMQRAEMSSQPARHAGLGLAAYSQVTSPIRRYADLVAHFQIKAFLAEEPLPFSPESLDQLILSLEPSTSEAVQVERKSKRYWSLEYFRQHPARVWRAQVLGHLREYENIALVMIDEMAFRVGIKFLRHVEPGEWVDLDVSSVDPRGDVIEFREVNA